MPSLAFILEVRPDSPGAQQKSNHRANHQDMDNLMFILDFFWQAVDWELSADTLADTAADTSWNAFR
jgi:hypothetical protein